MLGPTLLTDSAMTTTLCHRAVLCLVCWHVVVEQGAAEPMYTSSRSDPVQGTRPHLYAAEQLETVPWSASLSRDFVLLHYDRKDNALAGYQRSTGRVIARRSARTTTGGPALHLRTALVLGTVSAGPVFAGRHRDCAALTLAPRTEAGEVAWVATSASFRPGAEHTWSVRSLEGVHRLVRVAYAGDDDLACDCAWVGADTASRAALRSRGCRASPVHPADTSDDPRDPDARSRFELREVRRIRSRFCRELSAAFAGRSLTVVDARVPSQLRTCRAEPRVSRHAAPSLPAVLDTPRPPRAVALSDIKHAMGALDALSVAIDAGRSTGAALALFAAEQLDGPGAWWIETLYENHDAIEARATIRRDAAAARATTQQSDGVACAGPVGGVLAELLATRTAAVAPEIADVTAAQTQFVRHALVVLPCERRRLLAVRGFAHCLSRAHSRDPLASQDTRDLLAGVERRAHERTTETEIRRLERDLGSNHAEHDRLSETTVLEVESTLADTRETIATLADALGRWSAARESSQAPAQLERAGRVAVDVWCCAVSVEPALTPAATPCRAPSERLMLRLLGNKTNRYT